MKRVHAMLVLSVFSCVQFTSNVEGSQNKIRNLSNVLTDYGSAKSEIKTNDNDNDNDISSDEKESIELKELKEPKEPKEPKGPIESKEPKELTSLSEIQESSHLNNSVQELNKSSNSKPLYNMVPSSSHQTRTPQIQNSSENQERINQIAKIIEGYLEKLNKEIGQKKLDEIEFFIDTALAALTYELEKVANDEKRLELTLKVIQSFSKVFNKYGLNFEEDLYGIGNKAVEKVATHQVQNTIESNSVVRGQITEKDKKSIENRIYSLKKAREQIDKNFKSVNNVPKYSNDLFFEVNNQAEAKEKLLEISSSIVDLAASNKISNLVFKSKESEIKVVTSVIKKSKKNVEFSVKKLQKSEISVKARNDVEEGRIFDFNLKVDNQKVDIFKEPVTVKIPCNLKLGENPENITVYHVRTDGTLENVGGIYDENEKKVKFKTNHFSVYLIKFQSINYKDLKEYQWAEKFIEALAAKGIVQGKGGENFEPGANITRAEFSAILSKTLKLKITKKEQLSFQDVTSKSWFLPYVEALREANIISGNSEGLFRPFENIIRQDMAVMISNVLTRVIRLDKKSGVQKTVEAFKDQKFISSYAVSSIENVCGHGIMSRRTSGLFEPKTNVTRAEAIVVMYKVMLLNNF